MTRHILMCEPVHYRIAGRSAKGAVRLLDGKTGGDPPAFRNLRDLLLFCRTAEGERHVGVRIGPCAEPPEEEYC